MSAPPRLDLDSVLRLRRDVRYRLLDGEAVVVIQGSAEVLGLNGVGSRVLTLLDGRTSLRSAVEQLVSEYEVEPARLTDEVLAFGAELAAAGIVEPSEPSAPQAGTAAATVAVTP